MRFERCADVTTSPTFAQAGDRVERRSRLVPRVLAATIVELGVVVLTQRVLDTRLMLVAARLEPCGDVPIETQHAFGHGYVKALIQSV